MSSSLPGANSRIPSTGVATNAVARSSPALSSSACPHPARSCTMHALHPRAPARRLPKHSAHRSSAPKCWLSQNLTHLMRTLSASLLCRLSRSAYLEVPRVCNPDVLAPHLLQIVCHIIGIGGSLHMTNCPCCNRAESRQSFRPRGLCRQRWQRSTTSDRQEPGW